MSTRPQLLQCSSDRLISALVALALLITADAEVIYTEIDPWYGCSWLPPNDFIVGDGQNQIDMNGDGIIEFVINWGEDQNILYVASLEAGAEIFSVWRFAVVAWNFQRNDPVSNEAVGDLKGTWRGPGRFGSDPRVILNANGLDQLGNPDTGGLFQGPADDYIGVKFLVDGQVHYGWIHVDATYDEWSVFSMYGWAYEDEPGKAIAAGTLPAKLQELQVICQQFRKLKGGGYTLNLTVGGTTIGNYYRAEISLDLEEWEPASEKRRADAQYLVFKNGAILVPAPGDYYVRLIESDN